MKSLKTLSLTVLAAVAAMAFVGASSALAKGPVLCWVHEEPCEGGNQPYSTHVVLTEGTVGKLVGKNPNITILCLGVLGEAKLLSLGELQWVHAAALNYSNCGTSASHNECTIKTEELPLSKLSKTSLNKGFIKLENGRTYVACTVLGNVKIDCEYEGEGLEFNIEGKNGSNGHGMLDAKGTSLKAIAGGPLCPETFEIAEGLVEPLEDTYVVSKPDLSVEGEIAALCSVHEEPCKAGNQVSSVHMQLATGHVGVLATYEPKSTILCLGVLATANVLSLGKPQSIHTTELSFTGCGTSASHNDCTITTTELPLFELEKLYLNVGDLKLENGGVLVKCTPLGFKCEYLGEGLEFMAVGAGGGGHGTFSGFGKHPEQGEGGPFCPEAAEIDEILVESLTDAYITS